MEQILSHLNSITTTPPDRDNWPANWRAKEVLAFWTSNCLSLSETEGQALVHYAFGLSSWRDRKALRALRQSIQERIANLAALRAEARPTTANINTIG